MAPPHRQKSLLLVIVAWLTTVLGCENKSAPPAPAGPVPDVVLTTPEDAARSVFACLQARLRAVARRDQPAAQLCLERLQSLAATRKIEQTLAAAPAVAAMLGDDPIAAYVNNWASAIAYYSDGLRLEELRRVSSSPTEVALLVPAAGPQDNAWIKVTCVREQNDGWLVSRVELVPAAPARGPASAPASQPS